MDKDEQLSPPEEGSVENDVQPLQESAPSQPFAETSGETLTSPPQTHQTHGSHGPATFVAGMVFLGLLVVGGAVGYGFWNGTLSSMLAPDTHPPLTRMAGAMAEVETYAFDVRMQVESAMAMQTTDEENPFAQALAEEDVTVGVEGALTGVVDARELPAVTVEANAAGSFEMTQGFISLTMGLDADVLLDSSETIYVRLNELPAMLGAMVGSDMEGQWFSGSYADLDEGSVPIEELSETLSEDELAALREELEAYMLTHPIVVLGEPRSETAPLDPSVNVHAYPLTIDMDEFMEFVKFALVRTQEATESTQVPLPPEAEEALRAFFGSFENETFEVWIGEEDDRLYRFLLTGRFSPTSELQALLDMQSIEAESGMSFRYADYTIDASYGAYNEPVSVEAPEDAVDMESFMREQQEARLREMGIDPELLREFEELQLEVEDVSREDGDGEADASGFPNPAALFSNLPLENLGASLGDLFVPR